MTRARRRELGERGREFALKWHSAQAGARRFDQIYRELLESELSALAARGSSSLRFATTTRRCSSSGSTTASSSSSARRSGPSRARTTTPGSTTIRRAAGRPHLRHPPAREDDRLVGSCQLHASIPCIAAPSFRSGSARPTHAGAASGPRPSAASARSASMSSTLHRIFLHVFETNEPARRLYERVGFRTEGRAPGRRAHRGRVGRRRADGAPALRVRRSPMTLVAIHQPTFLPWLGWWDKLVRADRLVLLDDVQFPKKGGTWMNRVRMLVNGEPAWVTVPLDRSYHGVAPVRETVSTKQAVAGEDREAPSRPATAAPRTSTTCTRWSRSSSGCRPTGSPN